MLEKRTINYLGQDVTAIKVFNEYGDSSNLIEELLNSGEAKTLSHLVIGYWDECCACSPDEIIASLVEHKAAFSHLESLFIGDMDSEESELSWIQQCEYAPLLAAYPKLKSLTIKGNAGLSFEKINHANLAHFEIICGGLPSSVIEKIVTANLPNLESLRLCFGVDEYGFDGDINTIKPLLRVGLFPKLTHLGLLNSEIQDEIVVALMASGVLKQLKTLDLSMGVLHDKGGEVLLENSEKLSHLGKIKIDYHFMSDEMVARLQATGLSFEISDKQEPDIDEDEGEDYSSPMYTE